MTQLSRHLPFILTWHKILLFSLSLLRRGLFRAPCLTVCAVRSLGKGEKKARAAHLLFPLSTSPIPYRSPCDGESWFSSAWEEYRAQRSPWVGEGARCVMSPNNVCEPLRVSARKVLSINSSVKSMTSYHSKVTP